MSTLEEATTAPHRYIRAYVAAVAVPTVVVCVVAIAVGFNFSRIPAPIERGMIFPMAINPLSWGLWNALYVALHRRWRMSLGVFGAVLPLILIPAGVVVAHKLEMSFVTTAGAILVLVPVMAVYFVVWHYAVGFLNRLIGLPG
jgi:hypothetical protein